MDSLLKFLFPPHLEHPESTGRLDVFATYGPVDDEGHMRSGPLGKHVMTDLEIKHMIIELNRDMLYRLFAPRPRATVESLVGSLLPKALQHHYTEREIRRFFGGLSVDNENRMKFSEMQALVEADQRRRLLTLMDGGDISVQHRDPIPYQTRQRKTLLAPLRKKKLLPNQEFIALEKRLHGNSSLIGTVEGQNLSASLAANVMLIRDLGAVTDKWDRYSSLRGGEIGAGSYVKACGAPAASEFGRSGTFGARHRRLG